MELASFRPLGIDIRDTDDVSRDGVCENLRGFIPDGQSWRVNWMGEKIALSIYSSGDQFVNAHISEGVLFLWVKISTTNHQLWRVTKTNTTYDTKTILVTLSGAGSDIWEAYFVENKSGFYFNVTGSKARSYYYENGLLIPNVLPLLGNNFNLAWNAKTLAKTSFDEQYGFYGDVPGMLRNKKKNYCFRLAYRLKNGLHAMHSSPLLMTVEEPNPRSATLEYWVDFSVRKYGALYYFPYTALTGTLQVGEVINNPSAAKGTGNATIRSISDKYILIEEDYKAFASQESTITGQTSGATAKITSGATYIWSNLLYNDDTQSFFDLIFDGLYTDPENGILFNPANFTTARATVEMQPVTLAMKELIDGVDVFMTLPSNTAEEAITDGTYYFGGTIDESTNSVNINVNEDKLATKEVLGPDAFTHHWLGGHSATNMRGRLVIGGVYNNFPIPLTTHIKDDYSSTKTGTVLAWVTIIKDNTEYFVGGRLSNAVAVSGTTPSRVITLPDMISYPDRDAVKMELYWWNGSNYELANVYDLKKHPALNLAYAYADSTTYDEGDNQPNSSPDKTVSVFYEPEEFKVGDLQKAYWPLLQSYKVDSEETIQGVVSNVDELSQGQFGSHPLYILCDRGIYAGRLGDGTLFSRIDKIDEERGVNNGKCFTIKGGFLWGAGGNNIWVLRGIGVEEVQYPILNNQENSDLLPIEAVGRMLTKEAVIFAGAKENFVYDIRYQVWYTYKPKGLDHNSVTDVAGKNFFEYAGNTYELANLTGADLSESDDSIVNLDSQTKSTEGVSVLLKTKPIKINESVFYKSLRTGVLRGSFTIANGDTLTITLYGLRSTHTSPIKLIEYIESPSGSSVTRDNIVMKGNGSFQSYILQIEGMLKGDSDSYLESLLLRYFMKSGKPKL
jgi:hypothetical protein